MASIDKASQLQLNRLYLKPELGSAPFRLPDWVPETVTAEHVHHRLRFRLLHLFGPYKNDFFDRDSFYLVTHCVTNPDQVMVICLLQMDPDDPQFHPSFNHLNYEFSLSNFLTIECPKNVSFINQSEVNCHISSNPLYNFFLVASPEFGSEIVFLDNHLENDGSVSVSRISAATNRSINDFDGDLSSIYPDEPPDDQFEETLLLSEDEDELISLINGVRPTREPNKPVSSLSQMANGVEPVRQSDVQMEDPLPERVENPVVANLEDKIQELLNEIDGSLKAKSFNFERFIRANIHLVEWDLPKELTPLAQIVYPSNDVQNPLSANVIGIIQRVVCPNNVPKELIIMDENRESFLIKLVPDKISNPGPNTTGNNQQQQQQQSSNIGGLLAGNVVCIRRLVLNQNSVNICNNLQSIIAIDWFNENNQIETTTNQKLSSQELKRTAELVCHETQQLISSKQRVNSTYTIISFVGQYLAKRTLSSSNLAQVYILVPFAIDGNKNSYLGDVDQFIMDQIQNMTFHPEQREFNRTLVRKMMDDKRILAVTLYENHLDVLKKMLPLDLVALFNVHIKEDRFYRGFHQYILHGGNDFGRRSTNVPYKTILGELVLNRLEALRNSYFLEPEIESSVLDFTSNLDESVLERYGPNAQALIRSLNDADRQPEFERRLTVKKNIYNRVQRKQPLFKMLVNVHAAKRIASGGLVELVRATYRELTSPSQPPIQMFRISAYMESYHFADSLGIEFLTTAHLRQTALGVVCTSANCDYVAPFMALFPKAARCLATDVSDCHTNKATSFVCQKCQSPLSSYLSIQLYLQDEEGYGLTVLLSSPEIEELIGCTNSHLIYVDPRYEGLCRAFQYAFRTLCPDPTLPFGSTRTEAHKFRPRYDWILEPMRVNLETFDFNHYPYMANDNIFKAADIGEETFFLYNIRGIILLNDDDDGNND